MSESQQKTPGVQLLEIDQGHAGQRLDNFLFNRLKGVPRSHVYRLLRKGEVRVNRGRKRADYRLQAGDQVRLPPVRRPERAAPVAPGSPVLERLANAILYEDARLLALDKPAGIAVHGGSGLDFGVIEALRLMYPGERELELVHRLDRDTSGCLLVSKRRSALRFLHEALRANRIDKRYLALVSGSWPRDRMAVDAPLFKNILEGGERVVKVDPRGKPAKTLFRVRARYRESMLVEAQLVTGRTHQIRVHAAHLGTPILGDRKYGDAERNRAFRALGLRRLFLHAESLSFPWPDDEGRLTVRADLEPALLELLDRLSD